MKALPERRLLVRAGHALVTLDLTQIREVGGSAGPDVPLLSQALGLPVAGPGNAVLTVETGGALVTVAVDAVAGVVEVAPSDVLKVGPQVLLRTPGLLRAVMRVPRPSQWRGGSLLPTAAAQLVVTPVGADSTPDALAADLEPVALGRHLLATVGPRT